MRQVLNRRDMLKAGTALGAGLYLGGSLESARAQDSPNEKLNVALIGIGGQGGSNLNGVKGENIVALCDVDDTRAGKAFERFPKAAKFADYREMLDKLEKQIDAVVVSTPDHTHFHPSMMAMERGKHLYCEKPMAHSVDQVRRMTEMAQKKNLATQLGVQRHTIDNMHRVVELIQAGAIGDVTEVHSWIGGERGMPALPSGKEEVPADLKWDLWLGQAEDRPYHKTYCPYGWRFWWDFGTGEMGNWGCHILDIPYWALDLKHPTRVDASGPAVDARRTPKQMATKFAFPAEGKRPAVTLNWYHAAQGPDILREKGLSDKGANNLFIGTEGMLLCGFSMRKLLPEDKFADYKAPGKSIPDSPGFHKEWITACKGGEPATCHFGYSGPMSETVLLGNAAFRVGGGFDWHALDLKAQGNPRAETFLHSYVRKGWEI
jgi:predicted dehydrogenase